MSREHVSPGDTALLQAVSPTADADRPIAVVIIPPDGVTSIHRITAPVIAGRDPACELVLDDPAASRRHVRLVPRGASIDVVDLDSRNGTFVNGSPAHGTAAAAGSVIRVGSFMLLVVQLDEVWQAPSVAGPLVGGAAIAPVQRMVGLIAPTELSVLITGETGTGKEVVARLVHAASGRSGPFVAVNCAALPENLVESELFGHVRGAFTGADRNRQGMLSLAHEGTVFLDELGEMPLPAQAKLLRVLEDRMVRAVGSEKATHVDLRIVSATNVDLDAAVVQGRFRADLLARLSAVMIKLPSLRDRREDIPALIQFLLARSGGRALALSADALEALLLHSWPHNIRELDNLVRVLALRGSRIELVDLPRHIQTQVYEARRESSPALRAQSEDDVARARLVASLQAHHGNVRRVALSLGIARGHLYRLLKKFSLEPKAFRPRGPNDAEPGAFS
jgi:DNA-binding NtrC family response regulator